MTTLRLSLPRPFPLKTFEAVTNRVAVKMSRYSTDLDNFSGAHNGVIYRVRAAADYSKAFCRSLQRYGDAPLLLQRYQQERQLFGFLVSGFAALDSFHFQLFFIGAHLESAKFPTQTQKNLQNISITTTVKAFNFVFPGEPITASPKMVPTHATFKEWKEWRNIVAHRSAPGRVVHGSSFNPPPPSNWKIGEPSRIKIDSNLTPPRLAWLIDTLNDLINAADQFTQKYF
jgi:hypothetical protein